MRLSRSCGYHDNQQRQLSTADTTTTTSPLDYRSSESASESESVTTSSDEGHAYLYHHHHHHHHCSSTAEVGDISLENPLETACGHLDNLERPTSLLDMKTLSEVPGERLLNTLESLDNHSDTVRGHLDSPDRLPGHSTISLDNEIVSVPDGRLPESLDNPPAHLPALSYSSVAVSGVPGERFLDTLDSLDNWSEKQLGNAATIFSDPDTATGPLDNPDTSGERLLNRDTMAGLLIDPDMPGGHLRSNPSYSVLGHLPSDPSVDTRTGAAIFVPGRLLGTSDSFHHHMKNDSLLPARTHRHKHNTSSSSSSVDNDENGDDDTAFIGVQAPVFPPTDHLTSLLTSVSTATTTTTTIIRSSVADTNNATSAAAAAAAACFVRERRCVRRHKPRQQQQQTQPCAADCSLDTPVAECTSVTPVTDSTLGWRVADCTLDST